MVKTQIQLRDGLYRDLKRRAASSEESAMENTFRNMIDGRWLWLLALSLVVACSGDAPTSGEGDDVQTPATWYVASSGAGDGDGSEESPFASLADAERASGPGDVIYLVASDPAETLDGGIALKPGQKLMGFAAGHEGTEMSSAKVRLTNTTDHLDGVIVQLAQGNEVANLHFVDMRNHAIQGIGAELSGTYVHDTLFEGAAASEEIVWSVRLESQSGDTTDVRVSDSVFRDGDSLGGMKNLKDVAASARVRGVLLPAGCKAEALPKRPEEKTPTDVDHGAPPPAVLIH